MLFFYQNEWRLIGHAGEKPTAPIVKRVYLGEKVSPENEQKMFAYAEKIGFEVNKARIGECKLET